ncbi:helix-turn-helix transcriptional regulator [Rhizobium sp. PDO1-076]|uniref:helix-turn-helix transcriptional regulator n=1 Tax=Rhizobium sp. PDO1-076 TaxID=1125979 RepID=UPI00329956D4
MATYVHLNATEQQVSNMNANQNITLVSVKEVCKITSLSRTMINKLRSSGDFPKAVLLGEKRVLFVRSEVDDWIKRKASAKRVN